MSSLLEAVEEIIELLDGSILPIEKLGVTFERLRDLLEDSSKRRAERQLRRSAEDFDQDEAEALEVKLPFIAPLHLPNVTSLSVSLLLSLSWKICSPSCDLEWHLGGWSLLQVMGIDYAAAEHGSEDFSRSSSAGRALWAKCQDQVAPLMSHAGGAGNSGCQPLHFLVRRQ